MKLKKGKTGQSLLEVLVAVTIIILVAIALMTSVTYSIRNTTFAKNQSIANRLAQEAVEKIRAYRDRVVWSTFINNCQNPSVLGLSALPGGFSRTVSCTPGGSANVRNIVVTISWTDSIGPHQAVSSTRLTNWR